MTEPPRMIGIIGAGTMGGGIAQWAAQCGFEVLVRDADPQAAEQGVERIRRRLATLVQRDKLSREDADAAFARLRVANAVEELAGCAVIIEAVFEDLDLKRAILRELDAVNADGLLATNTSALSVAAIAEACTKPERVLGLHFFNPPAVMPLVEVVRAPRTSEQSIERGLAFVRALRKTPVVVKDTPGFIVNRVMRPFYLEALRILGEGDAGVAEIDAAVRGLGFKMGPFELMDLIGLDVNLAVTKTVHAATGRADFAPHPVQERLVADGRLGRKAGAGFYAYDQDGKPSGPASLPDGLRPASAAALDATAIQQRIRAALIAEATRVADEGTASRDDIATALKLGANWPHGPWEWGEI